MKHPRPATLPPDPVSDLLADWGDEFGCPTERDLKAYREGIILDDQTRQRIERHLANCTLCRARIRFAPDQSRGNRGQCAFRAILRDLFHPLILIFAWAVRPRHANGAVRLASAVLPVAIAGFASIIMYSRATTPPDGIGVEKATVVPAPILNRSAIFDSAEARLPSRQLSAGLPLLFAAAVQQHDNLPHAAAKSAIRVLKIGNRDVDRVPGDRDDTGDALPVGRSEVITVEVSHFPRTARLYAAVRRSGGRWALSEGVENPPPDTPFRIDCNFGTQNDDLTFFDVRLFLDRENLPPGPVADVMLSSRAVLATSPIYRVQRLSLNRPVLSITHVDGQEVWEGVIPWVHDEAAIQVYSSRLPIGSKIGLAVQPVRPLNNDRWVQVDEIASSGVIDSHWGDPGYHAFVRFAVTTFAVPSEKDFPPRGVPIPAEEWASYSKKFLSISAPVTVVKAGEHFTVGELNGRRLPIYGRTITEPEADIRGFLDRPISAGERIWLICAPGDKDASKPWVAGSTTDGVDNAWIAKAIQLWKKGQSATFDLLAVLTSADPRQLDPAELRDWANSYPHTINRVALQIAQERPANRR